ncbi:MAG: hypothetical protein EOP04_13685, partial [Proteobacteria bacterium]
MKLLKNTIKCFHSILLVLSLTLSSSCRTSNSGASDKGSADVERLATQKAEDQSGTLVLDPSSRGLANGWDSEYHRKLAPCLEGAFQYRGAQSSDLTFMRDFTYDQILKETGAGVYGKASLFGLVSAKVQG